MSWRREAIVYPCSEPRVRRAWSAWSPSDRSKFVAALQMLEATGDYWTFVGLHMLVTDLIHTSAWFFPWHRVLTWEFENALRATAPDHACLTVPVWDWAAASTARGERGGADWTAFDDFLSDMGGPGRPVNETLPATKNSDNLGRALDDARLLHIAGYGGCDVQTPHGVAGPVGPPLDAFEDLTLTCNFPIDFVSCECADSMGSPRVLRATHFSNGTLGDDVAGMVSTLQGAQTLTDLKQAYKAHGRVHGLVGGEAPFKGAMGTQRSPADPLFWGHHAVSDFYWDIWTRVHTCPDGRRYSDVNPHDVDDECIDYLFECITCGGPLPFSTAQSLGYLQSLLPGQHDGIDDRMDFYPANQPAFAPLLKELRKPPGVTNTTWHNLWTPRDCLSLDFALDYSYDYATLPVAAALLSVTTFAEPAPAIDGAAQLDKSLDAARADQLGVALQPSARGPFLLSCSVATILLSLRLALGKRRRRRAPPMDEHSQLTLS